jgi:hypothetical protein
MADPTNVSAILIKPIRDIEGKVVGLGELVQGDVAIVPGPLEFEDGTQQTTAYIPAENVTGFAGRKGNVVPATGDYTGSQVTLSPLVAGSSNVQDALVAITNQVSSVQGATKFSGTLGFNSADPAKPAAGTGVVPYYIFNTAGQRTVGDAAGVAVEVGDWLIYNEGTAKWTHLAYSARAQVASGTTYNPDGNKILKGTDVQAALDQADIALGVIESQVQNIEGRNYVNAFNGRSGVVTPADGDYNAVQVRTFNVGPILSSTEVQGSLNQLQTAIVGLQNNSANADALEDHINATEDAHVASAIKYAPVEGVKSTTVQDAIQEVAMKALPFFDTNGASKPIKFI